MDSERIISVATRAARQAGDVLRSLYGNLKDVRHKGVIDLVTEADIASEKMIIEADVLINVPVLKHHGSTLITAALKNLMGLWLIPMLWPF